tara:strand:- start:993 stop:1562 length:570 start_codon:yes stop_codon:yes gene_type:complete
MNIFYVDKDPVIAAQMMCDKHVVKMILESAQMLSTAVRVQSGDEKANELGLYKMAHKNHPSTKWARKSYFNFIWLYKHMIALMEEYTYRYGKNHATEKLIEPLHNSFYGEIHPFGENLEKFTDPPQCMPEECKGDDTVLAYQKYYIIEKAKIATWNKTRSAPKWWKDSSDEESRRLLGLHGQEVARGQV